MTDETTVSTVLTTETIEMNEEMTPVENRKFTEIAATTSLLMTAITTSEVPEITTASTVAEEEVNLEDDSDSNSDDDDDDELEPGEIPAIEDLDTDDYEYWIPELKNQTKDNRR